MLELDKNAGFQKCRYYFVDHAHRAVFWIDQTDTIKLDLPPVSSVSHLKLLLQQHYWTHVEFFPIHISIPQVMEEELIAILTHASIDASTSDLSTVPYDAEQCNTFLKLIREMPDSQRAMGFRNCVIGRIWSEICANHFVNLRGEPNARLSRNQRLLPAPVIESTWYLKATDKLFFGSPEFYEASISEHWVDKVCYSAHWRKLMLSLIEGWKSTAIYSLMLLVFSAAILVILFQYGEVIRSASLYVAQMSCFVSLLFSLTSFTSSILLIYYHKGQVENSASAVVDYLEFAFHARFGHKPLSILFSIPWGTFIWSLITTGITIVSAATACSISILEILLLWLLASLGVFAVYSIVTFFHIGGVRSAEMRFGGIARVWNAVNRVGQSTIVKRVVARSVGFLRRLRYRGRNVQQRPSQMTEEV
ncbi:hypothetical protein SISSUDRAFT_1131983 [Sistotremastrum suecicum HHB10207 ss-3]|uniref:Uncharacterized protein n=1 Tax=Sistotremastrum suecicum HHB10207 ss-3 TaxID=1314776 RepID=A0A165ZFS1_9AGAM|nr:hypothetical protein SISSUDRAFT_1131983 [Sistotremastrum suecicum HHB10207 ss-3]